MARTIRTRRRRLSFNRHRHNILKKMKENPRNITGITVRIRKGITLMFRNAMPPGKRSPLSRRKPGNHYRNKLQTQSDGAENVIQSKICHIVAASCTGRLFINAFRTECHGSSRQWKIAGTVPGRRFLLPPVRIHANRSQCQ